MPVNFHGFVVILEVYPKAADNDYHEVKVGVQKANDTGEPAILYMKVWPNSVKDVSMPQPDVIYFVDGKLGVLGNGVYVEPFRMIAVKNEEIMAPIISGTGRFDKKVHVDYIYTYISLMMLRYLSLTVTFSVRWVPLDWR